MKNVILFFVIYTENKPKAHYCSVQEEKEKLTFDLYFGFWKF